MASSDDPRLFSQGATTPLYYNSLLPVYPLTAAGENYRIVGSYQMGIPRSGFKMWALLHNIIPQSWNTKDSEVILVGISRETS